MKTFMPVGVPRPLPGPDDGPFWEAARQHKLVVQRCSQCGTFRHPPLPTCWKCHSSDFEWSETSGRGTIFTYTLLHRWSHPALAQHLPFPVIVVELDDADHIRMMSNLIDWQESGIRIGQRVEVCWDDYDDVTIPRFKSAE